jgi:hypothetical protein
VRAHHSNIGRGEAAAHACLHDLGAPHDQATDQRDDGFRQLLVDFPGDLSRQLDLEQTCSASGQLDRHIERRATRTCDNESPVAGCAVRNELQLGVKRRLHKLDGVGYQPAGYGKRKPGDLRVAGHESPRAGNVRTHGIADPTLNLARDNRGDLTWISDQHQALAEVRDLVEAIVRQLEGLVDDLKVERLVERRVAPRPARRIGDGHARPARRQIRGRTRKQQVGVAEHIARERQAVAGEQGELETRIAARQPARDVKNSARW